LFRYDLWQASWAMWLDHPLAGSGLANSGTILICIGKQARTIVALSPHDSYLQVLAETGVVGFIMFFRHASGHIAQLLATSPFKRYRNIASINWIWLTILFFYVRTVLPRQI